MTPMRRVLAGGGGFMLLSMIAVAWMALSLNRFQVDGKLHVAGLHDSVEVLRDDKGVPYIFAGNQRDLFFAQGFVTAQHRLFQIELYRHLIDGRLSEIIGEDGYRSDVTMRVLGIRRNAREHAARLDRQTRDRLEAYTRGYSAYVRQYAHEHPIELRLLGIAPTSMTVADAMAVLHFVAYSQTRNFDAELLFQRIVEAIGVAKSAMLLPLLPSAGGTEDARLEEAPEGLRFADAPLAGSMAVGSNSWAVAPERSTGSHAILANDPHLDARVLPGIWHPVGLYAPGLEAVGVAIPGLPGLMVGRNRDVAFGITNSYGDVQDVYVETEDPERPDHYLDGGGSRRFHEREEIIRIRDSKAEGGLRLERLAIRTTRRGPVISDHLVDVADGQVLTMRWAAAEEAAWEPSIGIDRLMLAESVEAVDRAAQAVSVLALNVVFAGIDGGIGFRATGRLPVRVDRQGQRPRPVGGTEDWVSWIPAEQMPSELRPERGWVGVANNDTRGRDFPYYYSTFFAPPYRYQRLRQLVTGTARAGAEQHWNWMQDTYNLQAAGMRPVFVSAMDRLLQGDDQDIPGLERARELLGEWDLHDDADAAAPLIYQALYRDFALRAFTEVLGAELGTQLLRAPYHWQAGFDRLIRDGELSSWLYGQDAAGMEALAEDAVRSALALQGERFGVDPDDWRWGKAHTILFHSPLRRDGFGRDWLGGGEHPYSGSGETLLRGAYSFANPWGVRLHDSMRLVVDLADDDKIMAVVAGGVVGRQFHRHFDDQLPGWLEGEPQYWWFSPHAVRENAVNRAVLVPPPPVFQSH
ncbi:MAG: penicillin acylase family protein [Aquisalimonadaceae bacterium]